LNVELGSNAAGVDDGEVELINLKTAKEQDIT